MKRFVIAAPSSGTGKTSIALGLMRALKNRGLAVQPFKVGPDYIDPAFHCRAAGRASRNLDLWMLEEEILKGLFIKNAADADVAVVEGVMGLYDGLNHSFDNCSTAHLARVLDAPVILVVDGRGIATSAAALVKGFCELDPRVRLSGVVFNKISGEKTYALLKEAVEGLAGVPCYGYVDNNSAMSLESRHLGLIPSVETAGLDDKLELLAASVEKSVDIDGLLRLASQAPSLSAAPLPAVPFVGPVTVGLAKDEAFNFYYQDNLDLMEAAGVRWKCFSPLTDTELPEGIGGIYIGGGFPEVFARRLAENERMRSAINKAAQSGMPIFAECGGYMYLMEAIQDFENVAYPMTGVLQGTSVMTGKLQRFGYVTVTTRSNSLFGPGGVMLKGHEFHRSLCRDGATGAVAYDVARGRALHEVWCCGENTGNVLAAYAHVHWYSSPETAYAFARTCAAFADKSELGGKDIV